MVVGEEGTAVLHLQAGSPVIYTRSDSGVYVDTAAVPGCRGLADSRQMQIDIWPVRKCRKTYPALNT